MLYFFTSPNYPKCKLICTSGIELVKNSPHNLEISRVDCNLNLWKRCNFKINWSKFGVLVYDTISYFNNAWMCLCMHFICFMWERVLWTEVAVFSLLLHFCFRTIISYGFIYRKLTYWLGCSAYIHFICLSRNSSSDSVHYFALITLHEYYLKVTLT